MGSACAVFFEARRLRKEFKRFGVAILLLCPPKFVEIVDCPRRDADSGKLFSGTFRFSLLLLVTGDPPRPYSGPLNCTTKGEALPPFDPSFK